MNDLGLLDPVYRALSHDSYSAGGADLTVTQWIDSPRISALKKLHGDASQENVSETIFAALGNGFHAYMEQGVRQADQNSHTQSVAEQRISLNHEPSGLTISGAIDLRVANHDGSVSLVDYKVTGVFGVLLNANRGGVKPEWERQLNSYRYLVEHALNLKVTALYVVVLFRDWQRAKRQEDGYPSAPLSQISVPMWSRSSTDEYVDERIRLHQNAARSAAIGDDLPACSDEEMWARPEKFAVKKSSSHKRASRLLDSQEAAIAWGTENLGETFHIEHRPGRHVRCEDWCGVADHCTQHLSFLEGENSG